MGGGIAQLAAMKGLDVILCDMHSAALERSIATTNGSLRRLLGKQQLTQEQADSAASRICRATDMQASFHFAERWQRIDQQNMLQTVGSIWISHIRSPSGASLSQECLLQVLPHQMFPWPADISWQAASQLQALGQADFIIEAINEDETSKKAAFLLLDKA